ncbi:murein biosynthesis integral membrane protein MurJ [Cohaesibacter celericrescens]|uniref:Probable lipid II flippase MurJ n=1 Tax=Cohaesibacter celericrescens TaxID=2067669 RepID=A0A2N5XNR4_9HYPH|nr:murein biosynthesis integral membrane protein MurJ [Cohaesibacter celericrescens]PLW76159.1 murein biosynthesis integral membrane protein MurJ [Cohaesibacter celericrescens]
MSMLKNFATVGVATLSSRVLGFVRDILIAASLGSGPIADAFFVAFRLPNLFRRLFAEGAFNSAFVPIFAGSLEDQGKDGARRVAEEIMAGLLLVLLIFTALAELAMPLMIHLLAPGFTEDPSKFDLAVVLTRITFPYLICMSLIAFLSGILNSLGKFAAAAFAPVLLNVVLIATLMLVLFVGADNSPLAGYYLAWGVFLAGFVQLAALVWALLHAKFPLSFRKPANTANVKKLLKLGVPGIIAGGVTQLNITIGTIIASFQAGAVSYLYYADRVYQLPLGVVGIAIGVVLLPDLARKVRAEDKTAVDNAQNRAMEFAMFLTLPAAVALAVVPEQIIAVLFQRGQFSTDDTHMTALALSAFAFGLPAFVLNKVLSPGFFARHDTQTPMKFAAIAMIINVIGSLALFPYISHMGIAVATTIAGWINALLLGVTLWRRGHFRADGLLMRRLAMFLLSSLVMGAGVWWLGQLLAPWFEDSLLLTRITGLVLLVGAGIALFLIASLGTGAISFSELKRRLRRRA